MLSQNIDSQTSIFPHSSLNFLFGIRFSSIFSAISNNNYCHYKEFNYEFCFQQPQIFGCIYLCGLGTFALYAKSFIFNFLLSPTNWELLLVYSVKYFYSVIPFSAFFTNPITIAFLRFFMKKI